MRFNLSVLPSWTRLAAGAAGAVAMVGGTVALTSAVTGNSLGGATDHLTSASPSPAASASPSPSASGGGQARTASPAARAVAAAVLEAEAQVLGVPAQQLRSELRSGTTLQALAGQRGLDESQFASRLAADARPLLDRDVQQGTVTASQEQAALARLARTVPNWDRAPAAASPSPTPTP
jgi:membrane-bound lytic murein transglycosylase B